ncbi:MAG: HNH endonuclease [Ramlibacter sp.]
MKLKMLNPSLRSLSPALRTLKVNPRATPRLTGKAGVERRARWLQKHPLCKHCEQEIPPRTTMADEVDHVIPLEQGGADNESNFQSLCRAHHAAKTAREAAQRAGKP